MRLKIRVSALQYTEYSRSLRVWWLTLLFTSGQDDNMYADRAVQLREYVCVVVRVSLRNSVPNFHALIQCMLFSGRKFWLVNRNGLLNKVRGS
jgi:hypothetical protein